jgi:hypothetical protein
MLHPLNALARIFPGASLARRQPGDSALLAGLEPGQRLSGRVHGYLANGEFLVELAARQAARAQNGQTVQMRLPAGVHPGDLLNLVFVSREPRPTFMIAAGDALSPPGVSSRVSDAGRFIDELLRQPAVSAGLTTLSSTGSLLMGPPLDSMQLARSLAAALDRSGLFYESHQAQWLAGLRSLPKLLLEPQARLSSKAGLATTAITARAQGTEAGAGGEAGTSGGLSGERGDPAAPSVGHGDTGGPVHPDSLALVRQQLDILETRQFALQGMAWPGQVIMWEAAQEKPQDRGESDVGNQGGEGQAASTWRTTVRLTLPSLGHIAARLRLEANGGCALDVHLAAAEPDAAAALRASAALLAGGLKAAGIELRSMEAEHDGPA